MLRINSGPAASSEVVCAQVYLHTPLADVNFIGNLAF